MKECIRSISFGLPDQYLAQTEQRVESDAVLMGFPDRFLEHFTEKKPPLGTAWRLPAEKPHPQTLLQQCYPHAFFSPRNVAAFFAKITQCQINDAEWADKADKGCSQCRVKDKEAERFGGVLAAQRRGIGKYRSRAPGKWGGRRRDTGRNNTTW